jgi:hypothetical protein
MTDDNTKQERWIVIASDNEENIDDVLELARTKLGDKAFFLGVYASQKQIAKEFTEDTQDD